MAEATDNGRASAMRWAAIAVLGALGFVAFLLFAAGARPDPATGGLVVAGSMLVFSLATLFRMVQVLSRPGRTLAPKARELAGADLSALREEKRRLLRALNELKFDFEMGKLSEEDFAEVKQTYELRAVEVMRLLDGSKTVHPEVFALLEDRGLSEVVPEPDAKAPEAKAPEAKEPEPEPEAEAPAAKDAPDAPDAPEDEKTASLECGACGGENDPDAKFCKHCGKEISA